MQQQSTQNASHNLILENRNKLTVTGVECVCSYDSSGAEINTSMGILNIGGKDISVSELSTQSGEIKITGEIQFIEYSAAKEKRGFLKKLVK